MQLSVLARCLGVLSLGAFQLAASAGEPALPLAAPGKVDFAGQIAPLFKTHCLGCHGADKARSGLRLDSRESALKGGYSGIVIVPGKSAESRLIRMVASTSDVYPAMPPKGPRLTAGEIGLLRAWIDQGAAWPENLVLTTGSVDKAGGKHWAFQPLRRPAVPALRKPEWAQNGIDRFILARLDEESIAPS